MADQAVNGRSNRIVDRLDGFRWFAGAIGSFFMVQALNLFPYLYQYMTRKLYHFNYLRCKYILLGRIGSKGRFEPEQVFEIGKPQHTQGERFT